jgi:hypothetical protein
VTQVLKADASPEKRLFISLITRDISLIAAVLDLIDNSINAAVQPVSQRLLTASDYHDFYQDMRIKPSVDIRIRIGPDRVEIEDTAQGISAETARTQVFKFGTTAERGPVDDRLSVYGIGLKRAIFKLGNRVKILSEHVAGGFDLDLNVSEWERTPQEHWEIDISRRSPAKQGETGTRIEVSELYEPTAQRINDGKFVGQLREAISKTYDFYLARLVNVFVDGVPVDGAHVQISTNRTSEDFDLGDVSCSVNAGIGTPEGKEYRDRTSGWFVFCNGRTVVSADKSTLTGWGTGGLGIFQPKHRPFLGTVFFVSADAQQLPWTTTKSDINEDSAIWQEAKRLMVSVGRTITEFLDSRYKDDGTAVASADLRSIAGGSEHVMSAAAASGRVFAPPPRSASNSVTIQYKAKVTDVRRVAKYLGRPSMGGAEVGRHTFDHFLRNEVGEG